MSSLRIDIVSDVVCPWCVIGFKRLEQALASVDADLTVAVVWHPFELNPDMPAEGENLIAYTSRKYDRTAEESRDTRTRLAELAAEVNFPINYDRHSRIYNTFKAHQLLAWALREGRQAQLKFALFDAYFTRQENVDDPAVLLDAVERAGLDRAEAAVVLEDGRFADEVRAEEQFWVERGIQGVPAFVIDQRYLVSGAQPPEVFRDVIERVAGAA